ncbi:hypothetical protein Tco_0786707 [Tanacetum coccineum]
MQANSSTVVEMMKLALWWLQTDPTRRHSMSSVIKVLKGGMNVLAFKAGRKYRIKILEYVQVMHFVAHLLSSAFSTVLRRCSDASDTRYEEARLKPKVWT